MNIVQEESLREQKKLKRRVLILEIARGLIASKGLKLLKVRDIAEAADCSNGSVYNEFGDFDGVILTVNRETVQALTALLVAVPKDAPPPASSMASPRPISISRRSTPISCARCSSTGWNRTAPSLRISWPWSWRPSP
jgi:AcrR family transcriptional regulator